MAKRTIKKITSPLSLLGLPELPDPESIKEAAGKITEIISEVKNVPKALVEHFTDADTDFRGAQKAFRGVRVRKK